MAAADVNKETWPIVCLRECLSEIEDLEQGVEEKVNVAEWTEWTAVMEGKRNYGEGRLSSDCLPCCEEACVRWRKAKGLCTVGLWGVVVVEGLDVKEEVAELLVGQ
ncbi:hypothetical protein Q8A73_017180 [Channa argus]|nr:hypothetical protein Q8A73_017180 [Channa argus]